MDILYLMSCFYFKESNLNSLHINCHVQLSTEFSDLFWDTKLLELSYFARYFFMKNNHIWRIPQGFHEFAFTSEYNFSLCFLIWLQSLLIELRVK